MHDALEFIIENDLPNALQRARAAHRGPVDHHWYEPRWDEYLQRVVRVIQAGETNLARVINRTTFGADRDALDEPQECVWFGERVPANPLVMGMQRRTVFNSVLHGACTPETDAIVELGAGNGVDLVGFWLAGGPHDAGYRALEITSTGRLCAELLGTLEPALRITADPFDFYAPDYRVLPGRLRHMLVVTSGAVEQIGRLPRAVLEGLLDRADAVTAVHFEPVGWQIPGDGDRARADAHRTRCLSLGYNENFWGLLRELEDEGRIRIDRTVVDIFGKLKHPNALIQWHSES